MKKINLLIISIFMISTTSCGGTDLSGFSTENDTINSDFTSSIEDTNTSLISSNSTTSSDDDKDDVNNNLNEFNLLDNPQEGVILHCFSWSIDNIISYLPQIAEAGFSSIQTSPLQPQLDYYQNGNWKDQWWKLYQPMGFTVADDNQNVLGSKDDLKRLCEEADKYGINVIVDAVLNHLGGGNSEQLNSNVKNYEPEIYNQNLIHTGVGFVDDSSAYKVIKGYQGGFPDIQTENQIVQDAALDMLKEYVDLGVDGFRFDAAKHIETPSDTEELRSDYWDYVLDNTSLYAEEKYNKDIYYYGEILNTPGNSRSFSWYTDLFSITDNRTGNNIRGAVNSKNVSQAASDVYLTGEDSDKLVLWAESHDTYSNDSHESTYVSMKDINKTYAIVGSKTSSSLYFVRPNNDTVFGEVGDKSFLSDEVKAINKFHNYFNNSSIDIESTTNYVVTNRYFDEEHYGAVIVDVTENGSLSELNLSRFKDGTYLDLVSNSNVVISNHKIVSAIMDDSCIMVLSSDSFDESNINNDKVNILIDNNDKYLTPSSTINISVSNASESYFQINSGQKIQFSNQIKIDLKDYSFSDNQDITLKVFASNETDDSEISKSYKFFNATSNNIYLLDLENQYDLSNSNSALWVWNEGENGTWFTDFDKQDYYLNFNIDYDFFIYVRFYSNNIDWSNCEYQTIDLNTSNIIYELNEVIK